MLKKSVLASTILASSIFAIGLGLSEPASASFTSCTGTGYNIADNVSPTTDCAILDPLDGAVNDSVSPPPSSYTVNVESFFSYDDWLFDGKYDNIGDTSGTDGSSLFSFSGNNQSGTFTLTGSLTDIENVMLVFKDGGDTNLVAYMLDLTASIGGTYDSPFEEPPFTFPGTGPRAISHISVYYRTGDGPPATGPVPEPGTVTLLGLGLLGAVFYRRRLQQKNS